MKHHILNFFCAGLVGCGLSAALTACENGDQTFDDYEGGTTAYFATQYPVRTLVMGDDDYDTSLDKAHKFQIQATFGGSYNGSNGTVQISIDESLCQNLTFNDGTPVKAMPANYYQLASTSLHFGGTFKGITEVQLTDAFFSDPNAVKNTYVIPLVMTSQTGFGKLLTGQLKEGAQSVRTDASAWEIAPKDFVLYCVKFQNKYSGWWLTNGTTSTDNIEKAPSVEIKTLSLDKSAYSVSYQAKWWKNEWNKEAGEWEEVERDTILHADLQLAFDGNERCTITSLTDNVTATGTGSWGDNTELKAWGDKDRDGMELNYTIDFGTDVKGQAHKFSKHEKMVWWRSGVKYEEFAPVYNK